LGETGDLDIARITGLILAETQARLEARLLPFLPVPFFRQIRSHYVREEL
jgi:hypothetical protein